MEKEEDSRNPVICRYYSTSQCVLVRQMISLGGVGKMLARSPGQLERSLNN